MSYLNMNLRCPSILLNIDDQSNVRELLQLMESNGEIAASKIGTSTAYEELIPDGDPVSLPMRVAIPAADGCSVYLVISEYSVEPTIIISAYLHEFEHLFKIQLLSNKYQSALSFDLLPRELVR